MKPWLKAGLIGGGVLSLLTILTNLIVLLPPEVSGLITCCLCLPLFLLAYPGVGVLAALWLPVPRTAGAGAREGALAGVVAGVISGLISVFMTIAIGAGGYQQAIQQLPPESLRALREMGLFQFFFSTAGLAAMGCCGGIIGILWAAAWGAIGGAIFAAAKKE